MNQTYHLILFLSLELICAMNPVWTGLTSHPAGKTDSDVYVLPIFPPPSASLYSAHSLSHSAPLLQWNIDEIVIFPWHGLALLNQPHNPHRPSHLLSLSASSVIQFQIGYLPLPHPEPICASPRPSVSHTSLTPSASPRLPLMSFVFLPSSFCPTTQKTSLISGFSRCAVMELLMQGITEQGDYISICS